LMILYYLNCFSISIFYFPWYYQGNIIKNKIMQHFSMTCSCGDVMGVDAENREEALVKIKATMNQVAIDAHMAEKHPGQPSMTEAECHAQIERDLVAA